MMVAGAVYFRLRVRGLINAIFSILSDNRRLHCRRHLAMLIAWNVRATNSRTTAFGAAFPSPETGLSVNVFELGQPTV
jgi:hypothetical protein